MGRSGELDDELDGELELPDWKITADHSLLPDCCFDDCRLLLNQTLIS